MFMFKRFGLLVFLTALAANANLGAAQCSNCNLGYCVGGTGGTNCCGDDNDPLFGTCGSSTVNNCNMPGENFPVENIVAFTPNPPMNNYASGSLGDLCVCEFAALTTNCDPNVAANRCWGSVVCSDGSTTCTCNVSIKRSFPPSMFIFFCFVFVFSVLLSCDIFTLLVW